MGYKDQVVRSMPELFFYSDLSVVVGFGPGSRMGIWAVCGRLVCALLRAFLHWRPEVYFCVVCRGCNSADDGRHELQ